MSGGAMAEEEIDYESDPEEAKLTLKMRRREASDDEEDEGGEIREKPRRTILDSDGEPEGAPAEYEDEYEEEEEDYDLGEEYVEEIEEARYDESDVGRGDNAVEMVVVRAEIRKDGGAAGVLMAKKKGSNNDASQVKSKNNNIDDGQRGVRKERDRSLTMQIYAHSKYFNQELVLLCNDEEVVNASVEIVLVQKLNLPTYLDFLVLRRTFGGRKLWESKDDRKWGHDKFEELAMQERSYEEHRRVQGSFRGRGRNRAAGRGYARGNGPKECVSNDTQNNNNQNNAPKGARGRGPRRYQPSLRSNEAPLTQSRQSGKSVEKPLNVNSVRTSESMPNAERQVALPRKQVFASNLNIASPPFYPSGSSTKDNSVPNKRNAYASSINRNGQPSVTMAQSSGVLHGKNIVDSIGLDKLYVNDSLSGIAGKPAKTMQMQLSGPLAVNSIQQFPAPNQLQDAQRDPGQGREQISMQASGHQFQQRVSSASQTSPPKATGVVNAVESVELESISESSKSKIALVPKGKGSEQSSGRGSFLYGGAQIMGTSGNMGSVHGDQNFPAFLPVMQFGGQHPGGIGVPAVGMAFPGYVAQPQVGLGNSEMTWLPVLAGAAGALGARYCPPYITVDGSYNAHPSGPATSITASSKEDNATNVGRDWKPSQKPELANDEFGQRQKNPRRQVEPIAVSRLSHNCCSQNIFHLFGVTEFLGCAFGAVSLLPGPLCSPILIWITYGLTENSEVHGEKQLDLAVYFEEEYCSSTGGSSLLLYALRNRHLEVEMGPSLCGTVVEDNRDVMLECVFARQTCAWSNVPRTTIRQWLKSGNGLKAQLSLDYTVVWSLSWALWSNRNIVLFEQQK
ncbi:UNVERIFIED_CONTAM: protein MLN51 [Sesamum angustifolium]|uniref:Protein MLN51 n=1 Tax=Sesamum angustifolium TaxID=2727405 RepID=A0AAW2RLU8_9LAMI